MLHLRSRVILKQKYITAIQKWDNVSWIYSWTHFSPEKAICTIVVLINYNDAICTQRNANRKMWTLLPPPLQNHLPHQAQAWGLHTTELSTFLGLNTSMLPKDMFSNTTIAPTRRNEAFTRESATPQTDTQHTNHLVIASLNIQGFGRNLTGVRK